MRLAPPAPPPALMASTERRKGWCRLEPQAPSADATLVHLVRHGRTALNAEGRFRGRLDPPLDDLGLREAADAGARMLVHPPVHVYSSPLRRALQTAEAIGAAVAAPVSVAPGLVDLDYGEWQGLTPAGAAERHPEAFAAYLRDPLAAAPPGGEVLADLAARVLRALLAIAGSHPGQVVAAVSHEVPIRILVARAAGLAGPDPWDLLLPTGATVRLTVREGRLGLAGPHPVLVSRRMCPPGWNN